MPFRYLVYIMMTTMSFRDVGYGWEGWAKGGQLPTQVLADQLTLSQPDGTDCVPYITTCPPSFRQLPTSLLLNRLLRQKCNSIHFLDLNSCQMKSNSSLNCKHALALMMARTQTTYVGMSYKFKKVYSQIHTGIIDFCTIYRIF